MIEKDDLILILEIVRKYKLDQWKKRKTHFLSMYQSIQRPKDMSLTHAYIGNGPGFWVFTVQINHYELIWYISERRDIYDAYFQWQMVYINLTPQPLTRVYTHSEDIYSSDY